MSYNNILEYRVLLNKTLYSTCNFIYDNKELSKFYIKREDCRNVFIDISNTKIRSIFEHYIVCEINSVNNLFKTFIVNTCKPNKHYLGNSVVKNKWTYVNDFIVLRNDEFSSYADRLFKKLSNNRKVDKNKFLFIVDENLTAREIIDYTKEKMGKMLIKEVKFEVQENLLDNNYVICSESLPHIKQKLETLLIKEGVV